MEYDTIYFFNFHQVYLRVKTLIVQRFVVTLIKTKRFIPTIHQTTLFYKNIFNYANKFFIFKILFYDNKFLKF